MQVSKYVSVGGITYLADLAIFSAIVFFFAAFYIEANVIGRTVGAVIGFFLHNTWTFKGEKKHHLVNQIVMYVLLLFFNVALSSGILFVLVSQLELPTLPSRIITDVIVISITFLFFRDVIFRIREKQAVSGDRLYETRNSRGD